MNKLDKTDAVKHLSWVLKGVLSSPVASCRAMAVAKKRNGPTATVKLTFCPELAGFENHVPLPA